MLRHKLNTILLVSRIPSFLFSFTLLQHEEAVFCCQNCYINMYVLSGCSSCSAARARGTSKIKGICFPWAIETVV